MYAFFVLPLFYRLSYTRRRRWYCLSSSTNTSRGCLLVYLNIIRNARVIRYDISVPSTRDRRSKLTNHYPARKSIVRDKR